MALGATINVCADSVKVDEGGSALAACGNQGTSNPSLSGSPGSWAFALGLFGEAKLRSASTYGCIREETWIDMVCLRELAQASRSAHSS